MDVGINHAAGRWRWIIAGGLAMMACVSPLSAQTVITDPPVQVDAGGSYRIDSSIDNGGSDAWIGGYNAGNTLVLYATGVLSNVAFGYVGGNSGANHNTVTVNGGSWSVTSDLGIGTYGDYNSLTIRNTGTVSSAYGYIGGADQTHTGGTFAGSDSSGGINNSVLVTGAGSTWSVAQDLSVGWSYASTNNSLTVDSGGAVTVGGYLNVGHYGSANRLTVSNGGQLSSTLGGIIGNVDFLGAVNDNSALVTGSGSVWNAGSALFIGNCSGSGNNLTIASGGQVNNGDGVVGIDVFNFASNSNWVHVTGSGSVWSNSGDLVVGYYGVGNNLVVDGGGQVVNGLSSYGAVIGLDDNAGVANNNTVLVSGSGSLWNNGSDLYVGYYSSSNSLTLASGGAGINVNSYIGFDGSLGGGQSNAVVVTGAGSTWSNTGAVNLGFQNGASSNSLLVAAAGQVFSAGGNLGGDSAAANNQAWITGIGSLWNNSGDLLVGSNGSFNSLVVDGGGQVLNNNAYIGWGSTAGSNAVRITGSGSVWTNNGDVAVGYYGAYNTLTVDSGGQVLNNNGVIGFDAGSGYNSVLVTGPGSLWSSSNTLYVGYAGANNSLTLTSGGTVSATNIVVGASDTSTGNLLDVSGGILKATNSDGGGVLNVLYGTLNLNSGTVAVDWLLLTNFANSVFNFNGGVLRVGQLLSSQSILVNGGTLSLTGSFANQAGSTFQLNSGGVIVPGSMANQGTFVQNGGLFDPVVFTNSGSVTLTGGTNMDGLFLNLAAATVLQSGGEHDVNVATNSGSWTLTGGTANLTNLILNGGGVFTNAGGRLVSTNAAGTGTLDVRNGTLALLSGTVTVNRLYVTNGASSLLAFNGGTLNSGGTLINNGAAFVVGDTGSRAALNLVGGTHGFNNGLTVGSNGAGNSLLVTNGAQVLVNGNAYLGSTASASNNVALVTGVGSLWSNSGSLFVGYAGAGNTLLLTNGGTVWATNVVIGATSSSTGNVVTVSGGILDATNSTGGGVINVLYGRLNLNSGTVAVNRLVLTNGANSVFNFNGGVLQAGQVLSAQPMTINGGTLTMADSFVNSTGGTFQLNNGSVIVPGSMANQGSFVQNGGLFDPLVFTNSGSFVLNGGTNVDVTFLNLAAGTVLQTGGEHDVNAATNAGTWTITGGTANLTNFNDLGTLILSGGVMNVSALVVTNAGSVLTLNGGTLNTAGSTVNNGSIFRVGNGVSTATLDLLGGTHSFANGLLINTNATLTGTGAITGSITDYGLIAPGNGLGILTDVGDLTMFGGSAITMELGGTNTALYDQLALTGAFTFGGTLNVSLVNGYTVQAGDWFNLFDFTSSSGSFGTLNLPTLSGSLYWNTNALYTTGILEADLLAGSLQVTLAPQAAIDAGAQWRVDGGSWQGSGALVTNLTVGSHTVSYTNLTGWIAPTNQTVQIAAGVTTTNTGTYQLTPILLAAVSRKTHGSAGTFDLNLNLNGTPSATVEPRVNGPSQLVFTFNKPMAAADGTLDATEFTLTNATFVSASIVTSNLTLTLTNVVDQSRITVVMNGLVDLSGNALSGTNAIIARALFGDENQSGTVNVIDLQQAKNNLGATLTTANYLSDVNCSGTINVIDLQQMKNSLTHSANALVNSGGSGGSGGTTATSLLVTGADTGSTTNTVTGTTTLAEALGATNLTWSTNGDAVWAATTLSDGSLAARSGSIGDLNVSWVETTVTGPAVLSFDWMVSSEAGGDYLTFSMDGVNQPGAISGEVSWQTMTFLIPSGQHRVTWTYGKNGSVSSGQDAGWVRRVVLE